VLDLHYYVRVILTCGCLVGVLFLFSKWTKTLTKKRYTQEIEIIDRVTVDSGVTLLLVNIRNKTLLLGTGNKDVKILESFNK
jgi:flagellar biogenesis protein FliO